MTLTEKKFTVTVKFSQKETKTVPNRPILFCLVLPRRFQPFSDDSRSFRKISEDYRRFARRNPKIQYSPGFPEYCCAWVEKRDHSPFEHRLKIHGPIFEQIRIYNTKLRLWIFNEKPSKHFTVFSPETVNFKSWPI